jgi:hypothetical protein
LYAWNVVTHGVYSSAPPSIPPIPDSYRLPGYPWLLSLGMLLFPQRADWADIGAWYPFVLQAQVALGTASVVLASLIARNWMKPVWAIGAGLLLAIWPHHVVATGALMPEVLFGFCLLLACFCFARGCATQRIAWYIAAGAAFGYAYLVNPLTLLFPPCLAVVYSLHGHRRAAGALLIVFLVPVLAMGLRDLSIPENRTGAARAKTNLVQGSWPMYHLAANRFRSGDPVAMGIMREIDKETAILVDDTPSGLRRIGQRMADDPGRYARWYASKPWLLWSWQIQVGANDLSVFVVRNSPLDRSPVLHAIVVSLRAINPLLSSITLAAAVGFSLFGWRRSNCVPAAAVASLALYFTVMHTVLQAEPRYAIAYRGLEAMLVMAGLAWLRQRVWGGDVRNT